MKKLTISIVTYNTKELTLKCLDSVFGTKQDVNFDVVVVDNASSDGTVEAISKKYPKIKIIKNNDNIGFGNAHNQVFETSNSEYILLLNSDTEIEDHSFDEMIKVATENNFAILSTKLIYPNGDFQPNGGNLPDFWNVFFWISNLDTILGQFFQLPSYHLENNSAYKGTREIGWVSGSVMLIKKSEFENRKLFDPKIFMYSEDTDLCWRAHKKNLKVGWTDKTTILHISGASSNEPHYRQWLGEYKGLIYLYEKYYGSLSAVLLKIMIYFFTFIRIVAFSFVGKTSYSTTYAKVIKNL